MTSTNKSRGFTLIEIVIVLAIAALIILVVLSAVTHGRKSQRDTNRKELAIRLQAEITTYSSNNAGSFTGFSCTSYCQSLSDPNSPTGKPTSGAIGASSTNNSGIIFVIGAICGSGGSAGSAVGPADNTFAILYWSELTRSSKCIDGSGGSSVASVSIGAGGGTWSSPTGSTSDSGIYAVNGRNTSACYPDNSRCMNYSSGGIYTAWAPTSFEYDISSIKAGSYAMTMYYRNSGNLPSSYKNFNINIYIDSVKVLANQSLPVRMDGSAPSPYNASITVPSGAQHMRIEWTNDWCCGPNGEDANFVLSSFSIQ